MGNPGSPGFIQMKGNIVYALQANKDRLFLAVVALASLNTKLGAKVGEIVLRIGYAAAREQVRTFATGVKDIYQVITRKPGAARPPIVPAADRAIIKQFVGRGANLARRKTAQIAVRGIALAASPSVALAGAGLGAGFLAAHGMGQLPQVQTAPPERGQPGMLMGVF